MGTAFRKIFNGAREGRGYVVITPMNWFYRFDRTVDLLIMHKNFNPKSIHPKTSDSRQLHILMSLPKPPIVEEFRESRSSV